jgi:hypothetical protein
VVLHALLVHEAVGSGLRHHRITPEHGAGCGWSRPLAAEGSGGASCPRIHQLRLQSDDHVSIEALRQPLPPRIQLVTAAPLVHDEFGDILPQIAAMEVDVAVRLAPVVEKGMTESLREAAAGAAGE